MGIHSLDRTSSLVVCLVHYYTTRQPPNRQHEVRFRCHRPRCRRARPDHRRRARVRHSSWTMPSPARLTALPTTTPASARTSRPSRVSLPLASSPRAPALSPPRSPPPLLLPPRLPRPLRPSLSPLRSPLRPPRCPLTLPPTAPALPPPASLPPSPLAALPPSSPAWPLLVLLPLLCKHLTRCLMSVARCDEVTMEKPSIMSAVLRGQVYSTVFMMRRDRVLWMSCTIRVLALSFRLLCAWGSSIDDPSQGKCNCRKYNQLLWLISRT